MLMLIDGQFLFATAADLLKGIPLTLELAFLSVVLGAGLALVLALMQISRRPWLDLPARFYSFVFRGSPLLVQIFVIYYGLGQFPAVRHSFLWTFLREPFWCAILAMALNTGAYGAVIIRGGLLSVPLRPDRGGPGLRDAAPGALLAGGHAPGPAPDAARLQQRGDPDAQGTPPWARSSPSWR